MQVTIYNRTGQEQGMLIEGTMYAVPAGTPGGGRGSRALPNHIADQMIAAYPELFSRAAEEYSEFDRQAVRGMPKAALVNLCLLLMAGTRPRIEDLLKEHAADGGGEAEKGS